MAFIAVATIGAGVGAGGQIGGAFISAGATRDAARMQADAANRASELQYQMYEQQRADQAPWRAAGAGALSQMADPYFQQNFSMNDFQQDPGYQFRMDQGQKALEASAAARGGLLGGNTLQAITQYGQNFASNEYQNAYNRFTNNQSNRFNRLASVAGVGQTANNALASAGQNYANQAGSAIMGGANAGAAGAIGQANAWNQGLSGIGNGVNNWMQYQTLNKLSNPFNSQQPYGGGYSSSPAAGSSGSGYGLSNPQTSGSYWESNPYASEG